MQRLDQNKIAGYGARYFVSFLSILKRQGLRELSVELRSAITHEVGSRPYLLVASPRQVEIGKDIVALIFPSPMRQRRVWIDDCAAALDCGVGPVRYNEKVLVFEGALLGEKIEFS